MDSYFLMKAGLHECLEKRPLVEGWLFNTLKRFAKSLWSSIVSIIPSTDKTVGEVEDGIKDTMKELEPYAEEDIESADESVNPYAAELIKALGIKSGQSPLQGIGVRAAQVLTQDLLSYSTDEEERMEQLISLSMFLESMNAERLADFLRDKLKDVAKMTEEEIKVVGYWFLRTILSHLYGLPDYKKAKSEPAISYGPTMQKEVRKLVDALGKEYVFTDREVYRGATALATFRVSTRTKMSSERDVEKNFSWVGKKEPYGFWLFVGTSDGVEYLVLEDEQQLYEGGIFATLARIATFAR